jgi:hypothetical protein
MRNIPFQSDKRLIKLQSNKHQKRLIKTEGKGKKLIENPEVIPDLPRKEAVAKFRLFTGHDCLAQHLHRIGCKDSPIYNLCPQQAEMNADHLLVCSALLNTQDISGKYWDARRKMTQ